ncbi:MAG: Maf family protein [Clostridia bacterium]|nr:Maf family protein [Clostridia bacterium]
MKEIVLASASPRRFELLRQIGLEFKVMPSAIEEIIENELMPEQIACNLALIKAEDVAGRLNGDFVVIGADTIVVCDTILGKPEDRESAFRMLQMLQGKWHEVITGVAVIDCRTLKKESFYERTRVKMRSMNDGMINAYINTGEPMDKAGAYGIQGMGAVLVEKIDGCYFNVVGFPIMKFTQIAEGFGIKVLG